MSIPVHKYDVVIVGGAAMGSSTAYHLLADPGFRGRVLVIEKDPTYRRSASALSAASIRQQFSTPLGLAWVAGFAAQFQPGELVLEPSAGTGLLAIQAELASSGLALNEVADVRLALLRQLFEDTTVTAHDAAQIHDRLDADADELAGRALAEFLEGLLVEIDRVRLQPGILGRAGRRGPGCRCRLPAYCIGSGTAR